MSDGNYGGNGSVWWQVNHTAPTLKQKAWWNLTLDKKKDHWIEHSSPTVEGHDPNDVSTIGKGSRMFTVTLRYAVAPKEASPDIDAVIAAAAAGGGMDPVVAAAGAASMNPVGAAAGAVGKGDVVTMIDRKIIIEAQLVELIDNANKALVAIRTGKQTAEVVGCVLAIRRPEKPEKDWEVSVEW